MTVVLLDTGPLIAYCRTAEAHHLWAQAQLASLKPPLLTCEAVLTEAIYLLGEYGQLPDFIWECLRRGMIQIDFALETEFEAVAVLMRRYADVPMDLADGCLVRLSELHPDCRVLTTDADFKIYRRFGRQVIPVICPT